MIDEKINKETLDEIDPYGEEKWESEKPVKKKISKDYCTIKNACPKCGGDVHDGTGTGWLVCKNCTWIG